MAHTHTLQVHSTAAHAGDDGLPLPPHIAHLPDEMQGHALHLLARLHTSLDIERLLQNFTTELKKDLALGALSIDCPDCFVATPASAGTIQHRFYLIIDGEFLCDLLVHAERPLPVAEQWQLELWLQVLAFPLRNALQLHKARMQVFRDPLTGIQNRIAMEQSMSREVASAQRHHTELSLLVIDIDHFKRINDSYGHSTGDIALQVTAQLIRSCLRDSDQVFRYGGEEFIALLNHTDVEGAYALADRIRHTLAMRDHLVGDLRIPITVSIGVHQLLWNDTVESFFDKADRALYRAKGEGRNRVCSHCAEVETEQAVLLQVV